MNILELTQLIPPTSEKQYVPSLEDLEVAEKKYGIKYPEDFIDFLNIYGAGMVCDFLNLFSPAAPYYDEVIGRIIGNYRFRQEVSASDYLFPVWPDKPGLFPFAESESGHHLYWMVGLDGISQDVYVFKPDSSSFYRSSSLVELLGEWLTRSYEVFSFNWLDDRSQ